MNSLTRAIELLPDPLQNSAFHRLAVGTEEIRLRVGQVPFYMTAGKEFPLSNDLVLPDDLLCVLERATGASVHSAIASMRDGYFSCGGLRIGLCGETIMNNGKVCGFQAYSSLAIRIPQECRGVCDDLMASLYQDGFQNSLIIAPPGIGKTTALREMIRCFSNLGYRTGVVDERNELSGMLNGQPQFDLGAHSDILVHISKAQGSLMLLRAMNPQIIAMDEITKAEDVEAIHELLGSGVGVLATVHGSSPDELLRRQIYRDLLQERVFRWIIQIKMEGKRRMLHPTEYTT